MVNESSKSDDRLSFVRRTGLLIKDDERYGRMYADIHDLVEASEWLIKTLDEMSGIDVTREALEDFLIDLDIKFVQHVMFHISSLRVDLNAVLEEIAETSN